MIRSAAWAPLERLTSSPPVAVLGALAVAAAIVSPLHPVPVLIGVGLLILVLASIARPELSLLMLVAMGPLELLLPANPTSQLSLTKLAGLLCFSTFLLNAILTRRRLVFDWSHALVVALLGIALLSTIGAEDAGLAKSTTLRYASFVALFFVLSQLGALGRMPELVSWVLSLSAAATGAFGLVRFFSGESPQVELPHGIAVDIGFALATTLPLTLWLLGRNTGPRRILVLCLVGVITLSVLLTLSRGALVGLGAGAVWLVVVDRRHTKAVLATVVAALIAVGLAVHFEGNRIDYGLRAKHKVAAQNIRSRLAAWHAAADFAVDRPLLGIGPGNFAARYRQVAEEPAGLFVVKVVHNAYLDVAAELGLVAMLIFLAYLGLTLRRLLVADRLKRGPPGFASALAISLVVGIFAAVTLSEQYFAPFWLIGGLAAALWHAPGADEQVDEA